MTPEAKDHLEKAKECLATAHRILAIDLPEDASRAAYLAAFHAAQAFIFTKTAKTIKTHNGVRSEFARFAKDEPRIDRTLSAFLGQSYKFKSIADYGVGHEVTVTTDEARVALEEASRFVTCIDMVIG